jgi:hypothetical protein
MWFVTTYNKYDPINIDCMDQVLFTWDRTVDKMGLWMDAQREPRAPAPGPAWIHHTWPGLA